MGRHAVSNDKPLSNEAGQPVHELRMRAEGLDATPMRGNLIGRYRKGES